MVKGKNINNPQFSFLHGGEGAPYYEEIVRQKRGGGIGMPGMVGGNQGQQMPGYGGGGSMAAGGFRPGMTAGMGANNFTNSDQGSRVLATGLVQQGQVQ